MAMTKRTFLPAVLFPILVLSCTDNDAPLPHGPAEIRPLRMELEDYKRELIFDTENRLTRVKTSSIMPGEVVLESTAEYFYRPDGTLEKVDTDGGFRLEYTWQDDRIIRTDEYIQDTFSQYHTFSYDERNRLHEFTTWQDIMGDGEVLPKSKEIYIYDSRDNLTNQFLYYYNTGIQGHVLLTSFEYSDYDNQVEGESLFDGYAFNPTAVFRKNNPGKMVVKNGNGIANLVDQYTYTYNSRGYPIRKTTTSIFSHNGSGGSYETYYFYQER